MSLNLKTFTIILGFFQILWAGYGTGYASITNGSSYTLNIYIDNIYKGTLAPGNSIYITIYGGSAKIYAEAPGVGYWGPKTVNEGERITITDLYYEKEKVKLEKEKVKLKSIGEQIERSEPVVIAPPESIPFLLEGVKDFTKKKISLKLFSKEKSVDDWYKKYGLTSNSSSIIGPPYPESTKFGKIAYAKKYDDCVILVYAIQQFINLEKSIVHHKITLLVCDTLLNEVKFAYDMEQLFPEEFNVLQYEMIGDYLYFNSTTNTYDSLSNYNTAYLICFDVKQGKIVWVTPPLTSNHGFVVYKDVIFCGFGFTNEDNFLFVVNRYTGKITQKIKLDSDPDKIIVKDKKLYVHTDNFDYIFTIKE